MYTWPHSCEAHPALPTLGEIETPKHLFRIVPKTFTGDGIGGLRVQKIKCYGVDISPRFDSAGLASQEYSQLYFSEIRNKYELARLHSHIQ